MNIVYMGTPQFAVAPLDCLVNTGYHISAIITAPDKPSGRGLQLQASAVKKYAIEKGLSILQPANLKSPEFIEQLKQLQPDLQIVIAFRILPEAVWRLPSLGTFNLHASLLPQYRGAAPINHAIMNGETITGVTTFFINANIDTGNIIFSEEVMIHPEETAGELHDQLMEAGAKLVLKTVQAIEINNCHPMPQATLPGINASIKLAPKIFKEDCRIKWNAEADKVFNFIRGLSPYPSAFIELKSPEGTTHHVKIFKVRKEISPHDLLPGDILTDSKTHFSIATQNGLIHILELQLSGKCKLTVDQFLRGFRINEQWKTACE